MSVQPYQLILTIPFLLFVLVALKVKPMKLKIALLFVLAMLAAFNPLRFEQQGVASLERFSAEESAITERVVVDVESFHDRQRAEMDNLKNESKEAQNETNF